MNWKWLLWQGKNAFASIISTVLCLVLNNGSSQRDTLTWSEASHSVRFLQGRVEFSFSSQVPSEVQNRYTCPCSTARNKRGHRVSWSRACMLGGKAATFPPHQQLSELERTLQDGCRSAFCLLPAHQHCCCLASGLQPHLRYSQGKEHAKGVDALSILKSCRLVNREMSEQVH